MKCEITAKVTLNDDTVVDAYVVNPGGWFGKAVCFQVGISNALNPFYIIEANHLQDAIDVLADSEKYGHLINVDEKDVEGKKEEDICRGGNDSHPINLDNVVEVRFKSIKYVVEIEDIREYNLITEIQTAIENWEKDK